MIFKFRNKIVVTLNKFTIAGVGSYKASFVRSLSIIQDCVWSGGGERQKQPTLNVRADERFLTRIHKRKVLCSFRRTWAVSDIQHQLRALDAQLECYERITLLWAD